MRYKRTKQRAGAIFLAYRHKIVKHLSEVNKLQHNNHEEVNKKPMLQLVDQ